MALIHSTLACNLDSNLLKASLPLFYDSAVDAIEWSFDSLFKTRDIPSWFTELIETFSKADRLIGHGVHLSLFSGRWTSDQEAWLIHLKKVSDYFNFDHVTEHFGFMTGENFHQGAPVNIPFNKATLALGQDRLKRIYNTCQRPVGLENLALAYSIEQVKQHGAFLEQLITPVNGFIILDLHNLYCQLHNFAQSPLEILKLYPLDRVREIHISGGSWESTAIEPDRKIRRDTHDEAVPLEVFDLLKLAIPLCPNLKYVVFEQVGPGLRTDLQKNQFQEDFKTMKSIVDSMQTESKVNNDFLPTRTFNLGPAIQNESLHQDQMALSKILETADSYHLAIKQLEKSTLAQSDWRFEEWDPALLETAMAIAQKWK